MSQVQEPIAMSPPKVVVVQPTTCVTPIPPEDTVPAGSWRCTNCGSLQKCEVVKKPSRPRRRVKTGPPAHDSPLILSLLNLFGLRHWEQFDHVWTVRDITPEKISFYLTYIRPELILIETGIATQQASKMMLETVTAKDLVTLLKQIAKIYGYAVVSRSRVVVNPETKEHLSHQEYSLRHYVAKPAKGAPLASSPPDASGLDGTHPLGEEPISSTNSMVTPQK